MPIPNNPVPNPVPIPGPSGISFVQIFNIVKLAGDSLQKNGVIDANGNFIRDGLLLEAEDISLVVADVTAGLKAAGLGVPDKVERIIQALPGLLAILTISVA